MNDFLSSMGFSHWLLLALCLLALELVSSSGFLLWIAIGALVTGLTHVILPSVSWHALVVAFTIYSQIACYLWWRYLKHGTEANDKPYLNQRMQAMVGRQLVLTTAITQGRGRVKMGDGYWTVAGEDCEAGNTVEVIAVDGVVLHVRLVSES